VLLIQRVIDNVNFPLNSCGPVDLTVGQVLGCDAMSDITLAELRSAYKQATDNWVETIRAEEALATPDSSVPAWDKWDAAHFREEKAHSKYTEAREAYKTALRSVNYNI
jgi:hypothetical protein